MAFTLGTEVDDQMTVLLSSGADFTGVLQNEAGPFSPTASIELRFTDGPTWTASILSDLAVISATDTQVQTVLDAELTAVKLWYIDGAADILWATGTVTVRS